MPIVRALLLVLFVTFGSEAHAADAAPAPTLQEPSPTVQQVQLTRRTLDRRQVVLSSLWAFASLNYLYCDLIGLMDRETHAAYEQGEISGLKTTDGFLVGATLLMQVPLSMVALSTVLTPKGARIASVAAGTFMTLVQTATLFFGTSKPHYVVSSLIEIGTTSVITVYSLLKLKPSRMVPAVAAVGGTPTLGIRVTLR